VANRKLEEVNNQIRGLWPGLIAVGIGVSVGVVLGRLVGGLLFRPSSGGPPDHPPQA
jgi:hypothetical protein